MQPDRPRGIFGRAPIAIYTAAIHSRRLNMESMERAEVRLDLLQENVLLLAAADGGHVPGRDWLQMQMRLMSEGSDALGAAAGYGPGPAGPYSAAVDGALGRLLRTGLALELSGAIFPTAAGRDAAAALAAGADPDELRGVVECKGLFNGMTRDELVCYACLEYPDLTAGSAERDRVMAAADDIVLGMVWKGIISMGRASDLLGKGYHYVMDRLNAQGYQVLSWDPNENI